MILNRLQKNWANECFIKYVETVTTKKVIILFHIMSFPYYVMFSFTTYLDNTLVKSQEYRQGKIGTKPFAFKVWTF